MKPVQVYLMMCLGALGHLVGSECMAVESTLARVTFWVSSERQAEFAAGFDQKMLPILKQHGLVESNEQGRPTVEGTFTRMFEAGSPAEVLRIRSALENDASWVDSLADLERALGSIRDTSWTSEPYIHVYRTPAGPGTPLRVGPGRSKRVKSGVGPWHTISMQGRIPGTYVGPIFQASDGTMWFGSDAGITRFDGFAYETFTTEDGLASDYVKCITEDREGNIWIGVSA